VPYTSLEEMRMKRSTGVRRIASSRICVPSTFVVTNSDATLLDRLLDVRLRGALTITSTPSTSSATRATSRMSPWTNDRRSWLITSARFSRLPAYVSESSEITSWSVFASRWRITFEEMKPAPPVTRTRGTGGRW
jgi:hypothetical protein